MVTQYHILVALTKLLRCRECDGQGDISGVPCIVCGGAGLIENNQANNDIVDGLNISTKTLMEREPTQGAINDMMAMVESADKALKEINT